jgi:hypothetical protein
MPTSSLPTAADNEQFVRVVEVSPSTITPSAFVAASFAPVMLTLPLE